MTEKYLAVGLNAKKWFVILGQTGIGKTHICTAICGEAIKRNLSVKYLRWLVELRNVKMARDERRGDMLDDILGADVIYIDDLFKRGKGSKCTDADIRLAFELIDNARALRKIVLISGEDSWADLTDIDEAITGRLKQMCGEFTFQFGRDKDKNYRLNGL
jgi:DNA replication protein DnaC